LSDIGALEKDEVAFSIPFLLIFGQKTEEGLRRLSERAAEKCSERRAEKRSASRGKWRMTLRSSALRRVVEFVAALRRGVGAEPVEQRERSRSTAIPSQTAPFTAVSTAIPPQLFAIRSSSSSEPSRAAARTDRRGLHFS
jgi:hypothetical protein